MRMRAAREIMADRQSEELRRDGPRIIGGQGLKWIIPRSAKTLQVDTGQEADRRFLQFGQGC